MASAAATAAAGGRFGCVAVHPIAAMGKPVEERGAAVMEVDEGALVGDVAMRLEGLPSPLSLMEGWKARACW